MLNLKYYPSFQKEASMKTLVRFFPMGFALALTLNLASCLAPNVEETENKGDVVATMTETLKRQRPKFASVTVDQLLEMKKQNTTMTLIDARTPEETQVSIIEQAITLEQWETLSASVDKNQPIVIYDTLGYRSIDLMKSLKKEGFENTSYLAGGVLAWAHAGQIFYQGDEATKKVHISSKAWDMLPKEYEAIHD